MKTRINILLIAGGLLFSSCSKDFLESEPTERISARAIEEASKLNPGLQNANIAGLYSTMYNVGTGGTTSQEDYGQKGYDLYSDILTGDAVVAGYGYGWYQDMAEYNATTDFTDASNYRVWRYYYRIIFGANAVIDGLGGEDAELENDEAKHIMGQARAMRGYAYFYLAQYLAEGYNPSDPILPIYTGVATEAAPLSTTEEVYSLIISDLTEAVNLLESFNRTAKNQINQEVAKGLLAYAYAAMNQYDQVKALTQEIINSGKYNLMTANQVTYTGDNLEAAGFNDINTSGWMWGVDLTLDIGLDIISWWAHMDVFTYGYPSVGDVKAINSTLYEAIPEDDIRKGQHVDLFQTGDNTMLAPANKFYDPNRIIDGQRYITTDYVYMRVAEMYLLLAEASVKTGDEATAREALKALLAERVSDFSYVDQLSGEQLMDEIFFQTRVELWGEGKIYLAVKRLEKTIVLPPNHLAYPGATYSFDSDELTFEIPQSEIQNNPFIER